MWQPNASMQALRQRAAIVKTIRSFFEDRAVLEVETPNLSQATVTDQHLASFSTEFVGPGFAHGQTLYLQTSPEYAMKRLLAQGSGCIYQIGKAFRNEESGRFHNPEFTLLEWYRVGFDHFALMIEVDELLQLVLETPKAERCSYQSAFVTHVGIDPLDTNVAALQQALVVHGMGDIAQLESCKDTLMQLLFSQVVEPNIGHEAPCFIYHFPASQAALAKIHGADNRVAERFEVYFKGIELANGFHELTDGQEQLARFELDNVKRLADGKSANNIDGHLIDALNNGMPDCAGVALGIDRLIMLALAVDSIDQVLSFAIKRA
jgi:lysyl-tRNA synthetase class 2